MKSKRVKQFKSRPKLSPIDQKASRYYALEAQSWEARKNNAKYPPFHTLPKKEKDYYRARAQQFAQNYPKVKL